MHKSGGPPIESRVLSDRADVDDRRYSDESDPGLLVSSYLSPFSFWLDGFSLLSMTVMGNCPFLTVRSSRSTRHLACGIVALRPGLVVAGDGSLCLYISAHSWQTYCL